MSDSRRDEQPKDKLKPDLFGQLRVLQGVLGIFDFVDGQEHRAVKDDLCGFVLEFRGTELLVAIEPPEHLQDAPLCVREKAGHPAAVKVEALD